MAAYMLLDAEITDPAGYEEYKKAAGPTVLAHGGEYVVRGAPVEVLEGEWKPQRLVIIQFESMARAKAWWGSKEYQAAKPLRHRSARTKAMLFVEGA